MCKRHVSQTENIWQLTGVVIRKYTAWPASDGPADDKWRELPRFLHFNRDECRAAPRLQIRRATRRSKSARLIADRFPSGHNPVSRFRSNDGGGGGSFVCDLLVSWDWSFARKAKFSIPKSGISNLTKVWTKRCVLWERWNFLKKKIFKKFKKEGWNFLIFN